MKKKTPNKLQFKGEFRNTASISPLSESVCGQRTHEFVINVIEQQLAPIIHWGLILHFLSPQQGHVPSDTRDLVCLFMANEFFFFQPSITDFSIHPTDRHPLGCGTDLVNCLFQFPDSFINIIVYNFQVKVVSVSFLKEFTLCG